MLLTAKHHPTRDKQAERNRIARARISIIARGQRRHRIDLTTKTLQCKRKIELKMMQMNTD